MAARPFYFPHSKRRHTSGEFLRDGVTDSEVHIRNLKGRGSASRIKVPTTSQFQQTQLPVWELRR